MLHKMFHRQLIFLLIFLCPFLSPSLSLTHHRMWRRHLTHMPARQNGTASCNEWWCLFHALLLGMWVDRRGSDDKLQSAVLSHVRDDADSVGEKKKKENKERWVDFTAKIGGSSFYFMMIFFLFCNWSHYATSSSTHVHETEDSQ